MGLQKNAEAKATCAAPVSAVFICPMCGDCLSSQSYLDEHVRVSHAERPQGWLKCSYCPYTSNWRSSMTQHERIHTGARPFSCPSCNKTFTQKSNLVKHQRVHTGEKPYKCTICGQWFSDSSALSNHRKLHFDGGKPHACLYCGRAFRSKSHLTQHLVTHTGERQHACRVCGQKFTQAGSARQHERQVHNVPITLVDSGFPRDDVEKHT